MTREEKEQTGKYVLQIARLLEDGCYQQEMLLKAVHIIDEALEQEPTTKNDLGVDCISRQGTIDAIRRIHPIDTDYDCTLLDKDDVMYVLNDMPSVTSQEPKWISVKDRLPQRGEYGDVLVTFIPTAGTLWATVMIARYSDLMGIAKPCFHIGEVGKKSFENITPYVIAWMPLPKPYESQESEG